MLCRRVGKNEGTIYVRFSQNITGVDIKIDSFITLSQ